MPRLQAARIQKIAADLLHGAGASAEEAAIVAKHSAEANLTGHDSHGIRQIPSYISRIERGHIVPGASIDIVSDTPTTTVIDGNWGFGYVVTEEAMKRTIAKGGGAKRRRGHGVPARTCRTGGGLSVDGGGARDDRSDDRGFRSRAEGGGAVRRAARAPWYESDLDCGALGSRGPALLRYVHCGGGGGEDQSRRRARATGAGRLAHRRRRSRHHGPGRARPRWRVAAARRRCRLQGLRAGDHGGDLVGPC